MDVKAFIDYLLSDDRICEQYRNRVKSAHGKSDLFEIMSDANGGEFICSQITEDTPVSYGQVEDYFRNHINGKRIITHTSPGGNSYTSKIFCHYNGTVAGDTTILTLLGCRARVEVIENYIMQINCDLNTVCEIHCPTGSRAICTYWGEKPSVSGDGQVRFIKGEK